MENATRFLALSFQHAHEKNIDTRKKSKNTFLFQVNKLDNKMGKKRRQDVLESELDPDPESEDLSMLFPPSPILPTNDIQPVDNDHNDSLQQNHDLPLDNLEQTLLFQPSNSQEIVDNATFQHLDSFLQPTPSIPRIFIPTIPNVPSIRYMPKHLIPIPAAEIIRISDFQQSFQDLLKNTGYVGNNLQKMLVEKLGNDEFSKLEESCRYVLLNISFEYP